MLFRSQDSKLAAKINYKVKQTTSGITFQLYMPNYASLTNKEMLNYTSINYSWPLPLSNYSSQIRINDNDNLVFIGCNK